MFFNFFFSLAVESGPMVERFQLGLAEQYWQISNPLSLMGSLSSVGKPESLNENESEKRIYNFVYNRTSHPPDISQAQLFEHFVNLSHYSSLISGKLRSGNPDSGVGYVTLIFMPQSPEPGWFRSLLPYSDSSSHAALIFEYLDDLTNSIKYCASHFVQRNKNVPYTVDHHTGEEARKFVISSLLYDLKSDADLSNPNSDCDPGFVRYYPYKSIPIRKEKIIPVVSGNFLNLAERKATGTTQALLANCCHYVAYLMKEGMSVGSGQRLIHSPDDLRSLFDSIDGRKFRKPDPIYQDHSSLKIKDKGPFKGLYSCHWPFFFCLLNDAMNRYFLKISDCPITKHCNFYYRFYSGMKYVRSSPTQTREELDRIILFMESMAKLEQESFYSIENDRRSIFSHQQHIEVPLFTHLARICFERGRIESALMYLNEACNLRHDSKMRVLSQHHGHFVGKKNIENKVTAQNYKRGLRTIFQSSECLELSSMHITSNLVKEVLELLAHGLKLVRIIGCSIDEMAFLTLTSDGIRDLPRHPYPKKERHEVEIIGSRILEEQGNARNGEENFWRIRWFQNLTIKDSTFAKDKGNYCRESFFLDTHFINVTFSNALHFYQSRLHGVSFVDVENLDLAKEKLCPQSVYVITCSKRN